VRQPPEGLDPGGGRSHHRLRAVRRQRAQQHAHEDRTEGHPLPGHRLPRHPPQAQGHQDLGHVRADVRRATRHAGTPARPSQALYPAPDADGRVESEMTGATPFPRHWVYDGEGKLIAKSGMIDFKEWYTKVFGKKHTPWGNEDSPAFVTTVETALERQLSGTIMRGGKKPKIKKIKEGGTLVEQGEKGEDLFLLLDGVLAAEFNGEKVN